MRGREGCVMVANIGIIFCISMVWLNQIALAAKSAKERVYYLDPERVNLTYCNPKYIRDMNMTARRFGRRDPIHYVQIHGELLVPLDNNVVLDMQVHEFLSNEYRPSFLEFHYHFCDMFNDKYLIGFVASRFLPACPLPKGVYHLVNMSIPDFPLLSTFPFRKGRVFLKVATKGPEVARERILDLHYDVVIKERWR